jgi:hypothetical protein
MKLIGDVINAMLFIAEKKTILLMQAFLVGENEPSLDMNEMSTSIFGSDKIKETYNCGHICNCIHQDTANVMCSSIAFKFASRVTPPRPICNLWANKNVKESLHKCPLSILAVEKAKQS